MVVTVYHKWKYEGRETPLRNTPHTTEQLADIHIVLI